MTQIGALVYADWRALVNDGRRIIRSPGRIAMWILSIGLLGLFLWSRLYFSRGRLGASQADTVRADYFVCTLLALLALALASGRGAIGIFRSRAEARFIIGSPVAAPLAIAYLQARAALGQGLRLLLSFIYFVFVFGPRRVGPIGALADLILILAAVSAAAAVVLPRRLLPRPAAVACGVIGVPLVLVALAPAARDSAKTLPLPAPVADTLLRFVPATWHPGRVLLEPNPLWLLAMLAIAGAAIWVLAAAGRDVYPELYALSTARIDRLERWRARRTLTPRTLPVQRAVPVMLPAPAGVFVFVWKSIVEFRRRTKPPALAIGATLWCVAGFVAARVIAPDRDALFITLVVVIMNVMLLNGITATGAIAGEIRRPMFWLAAAGLFERLCALALARVWRPIATLELVAASFAIGGGGPIDTLFCAIALPAFVALLAGVSFAAFAFFPSSVDARGPVTVLRLFLSLVLVVPPFAAAAIVTVVTGELLGIGAAVLLAIIEAGALVGIAAWRLDGRVDRLPA